MSLLNKTLIGSVLLSGGFTQCTEKQENEIPNVIIIYTDDQGTVDLNCFGAEDLVTPHTDKLVESGVKFTQFYGHTVCSPSRAGLLTGKTPERAGVQGNVGARGGLGDDQYTMADMFKDAGYKTALIGKWHLGESEDKQPGAKGFDYSFGHLGGCIDNYSHFFYWAGPNRHDLYRNGEEIFYCGEFFPDLMVKEASLFMEENKRNPFFLYFSLNTPHYPYQGTPEWINLYQEKGVAYPRDLYAAFISTQDEKIGELLQKLEDLGLRENTIVIFQSDNGHSTEQRAHYGGGSAGIYRGAKFSLFEGGIRVPAAISWPAGLNSGQVRDQMAVNADWMPTLADLCGINLDTRELDGRSLVPVIQDENAESQHINGYCWQFQNHWAARKGEWKLLGNPRIQHEEFLPADSLFLVNLKNDPGEMNNLAEENPGKVKELKNLYEKWLERNQEYLKK